MSDLLKIDGAACSGSGVMVRQSMACATVTGTPVQAAPRPSRWAGPCLPVQEHEETPFRFRSERRDPRCVPGVAFATRELLPQAAGDKALEQAVNVATLPGTVRASYAMPDG
ncbi:hypothetical protein [Streptomyces anulatus]|uniref:hypothetical protein n=1 Tax=Streptomyces anulatus TaxID=1892 RepID=UPI0036AE5DF4